MFVVVFTLVSRLTPSSNLVDCLQPVVGCCRLLQCTIITAYPINSDSHAQRSKQVACHWVDLLMETGDCFRHNVYVYILYLKCADAILTILCMGLLTCSRVQNINVTKNNYGCNYKV